MRIISTLDARVQLLVGAKGDAYQMSVNVLLPPLDYIVLVLQNRILEVPITPAFRRHRLRNTPVPINRLIEYLVRIGRFEHATRRRRVQVLVVQGLVIGQHVLCLGVIIVVVERADLILQHQIVLQPIQLVKIRAFRAEACTRHSAPNDVAQVYLHLL